jgi:hypothetical protein
VFLDEPPYHNSRFGGFLDGPLMKDHAASKLRKQPERDPVDLRYWRAFGAGLGDSRRERNHVYGEVDASLSQKTRLSLRQSRTFRTDKNCADRAATAVTAARLGAQSGPSTVRCGRCSAT